MRFKQLVHEKKRRTGAKKREHHLDGHCLGFDGERKGQFIVPVKYFAVAESTEKDFI